MRDIEEGFADLDERIPGSRRTLAEDRARRAQRPKKEKPTGWDRKPLVRAVNGRNHEFFMIGALAEALGKSPPTVRGWIRKGILPKARYRLPAKPGTLGDTGKRLWTRAEIEGILKIAQEEGIVRTRDESGFNVNYIPDIQGSNFVQRVRDFWKGSK